MSMDRSIGSWKYVPNHIPKLQTHIESQFGTLAFTTIIIYPDNMRIHLGSFFRNEEPNFNVKIFSGWTKVSMYMNGHFGLKKKQIRSLNTEYRVTYLRAFE